MLNKIVKVDKYGNTVISYRLTKKDTFIQNIMVKKNGVVVDAKLIDSIIFKLGDYDYNEVMQKDYVYLGDAVQKWLIKLTTEETGKLIEDETYRYQIIIRYKDNTEVTVMSANFTITNRIEVE